MAQLEESFVERGVPKTSESEIVSQSGLRGDSPAKKAQGNLKGADKGGLEGPSDNAPKP